MQMLRQLEFSLFDFRLHQTFDPANPDQIPSLLQECLWPFGDSIL